MTKALVTGGCGFVGRHLVSKLLHLNYEVWIVDDLSTGLHPNNWLEKSLFENQRVNFIHGDVRDFFRTNNLKNYPQFDYVIHLAAVVGGRTKIDGDPIAVAQDISIDAEFFSWAVKARPNKILYASSSAAYPINLQTENNALQLKEGFIQFGDSLGQPDMTYGWSKLTGEYLAQIASKYYGLSVSCVRPFSGYGEDQDETYPVPAIALRAAKKENPLYVWGSGKQGRDFVYIDDCIDAMLLTMNKISNGEAVNIGSGKLTNFLEVAQIFADIAGYKPLILPMLDKPVGVYSRYADVEKLNKYLGWYPRISIFEGFKKVFERAKQKINNPQ